MKDSTHFLFQACLKQILDLFQKAISQDNPALFLYKKKARDLLFTAESLVRLVNRLINDKEVKRSLKNIKKLEDELGRIDALDNYLIEFSKNKSIKKAQLDYFRKKKEKLVTAINTRLIKKAYFQKVFHDIISEFTINFNDKALILKLRELIKEDLKGCYEFYLKHPQQFTDNEKQVHEIRRKLRWISIYAQSLNGIIVLHDDKTKYKWEKKFITKTEKKSPFSKLPVKKDLVQYIGYNKKAFLALSHVINALGVIKDNGLKLEQLKNANKKTGASAANPEKMAMRQLKAKQNQEALLKEAHDLLSQFFISHRIHELLIL